MKGLLYKEVASLLGLYKKNLTLVAVIYGALSVMTRNNFFLFFGIWMMGFYSLSNFSLDESSGWGRYARTLPVSDRQIVGAKFLTALVFGAPVAVVCLCIQSENVCKCPWGVLRLRSRKWINNVTEAGK